MSEKACIWFDFLIAHWDVLPEDVRLQVKAYEVLRQAAQFHSPRSVLAEVWPLEAALRETARRYGGEGDTA